MWGRWEAALTQSTSALQVSKELHASEHLCRPACSPEWLYSQKTQSVYLRGSVALLATTIFWPVYSFGYALKWAVTALSTLSNTAAGVLISTRTCALGAFVALTLPKMQCIAPNCSNNGTAVVST